MTEHPHAIAWAEIEPCLDTLEVPTGGFTTARRGIVTMPDGQKIFVKIGLDKHTSQWAHTEIGVYEFLRHMAFPFAPKLLATNHDQAAFAIEALPAADGWDWSAKWTAERLDKTLEAMDKLAEITLPENGNHPFKTSFVDETADGWRPIHEDPNLQIVLREKLRAAGRAELADTLIIAAEAEQSAQFMFDTSALVHNDVRADNCAWNEKTNQVQLVDWNWAQLSDRRIDSNSFLVHVCKSGFTLLPRHIERLDPAALQWLAGFWLRSALYPLVDGGPELAELRDFQFESGLLAYQLSKRSGA